MKGIYAAVLPVLLISLIFLAGCTAAAPVTAVTPAVTSTPQVVYVTVTVTPEPEISTASTTAAPVIPAITTFSPTDPIIHRYVYKYMTADGPMGHELKFYPGGTVDYRIGFITTISDNIIITNIVSEASGTWVTLGDMSYYIKVLPTAQGGAQIIRQFKLVPAHEDPRYPGIVLPEQIIGSDGSVLTRTIKD